MNDEGEAKALNIPDGKNFPFISYCKQDNFPLK